MDALLKAALVGTAKHPGPPADLSNAAEALVAALEAEDQEHQLLLRAGACSLLQQCGQVARTDVSRLEPSPLGSPPLLSRRWVDLLRQTFTSDRKELLQEFLRALHQTRGDLPHELLPLALDQGDQEVREALLPVLGDRGRWLSRFNPNWNWVTQGAQTLSAQGRSALQRAWEEGTLAQRRVALTVLRQSDPDEGRRWLEAALPGEKADHRAALVEQLRVGLGAGDESLLDRLLDDRSDQVRVEAAQLLRKLPDSQFTRRMLARGEALLRVDPKAKAFRLKVFPPDDLPDDWLRDGIPVKVQGRGKRAFWTMMVLSSIPVTHWDEHFRKSPAELVAAIRGDDYEEDVLLSWTRALCGFGWHSSGDGPWAEALWQVAVDLVTGRKGKTDPADFHRIATLVRVMPGPLAEQKVEPFLRGDLKNTQALSLMLPVLPRPWSPGFAQAYLRQARAVLKSAPIDQAYEWLKTLEPAALALPPGAFAAALAPWDADRPAEKSWTANAIAQAVERFADLVRVRQSFYAELQKAVRV